MIMVLFDGRNFNNCHGIIEGKGKVERYFFAQKDVKMDQRIRPHGTKSSHCDLFLMSFCFGKAALKASLFSWRILGGKPFWELQLVTFGWAQKALLGLKVKRRRSETLLAIWTSSSSARNWIYILKGDFDKCPS